MSKILELAELSRLAYKGSEFIIGGKKHTLNKDKLKLELSKYGYEKPIIFDDPDSGLMCFIVKRNGLTYLIFRGTSNIKNWLTDAKAIKKKTPYGKVHKGFYDASQKLLKFILTILRKHDIILIGGHSLGAALGLITKVILEERGYDVRICPPIGCPRIGDRKFIKNTRKKNCVAILNNLDLVTEVPLSILGWRHYNNIYFNCKGELSLNRGYFARRLDRITTLLKNRNPLEWVEDHSSNEYCKLLRKNLVSIKKYEEEVLDL